MHRVCFGKKCHFDNNPKIRAKEEEFKKLTKNAFSDILIPKLCEPTTFLKKFSICKTDIYILTVFCNLLFFSFQGNIIRPP